MSAPVCGFCKNGPVGNAATWLDGKPRPPAPCPRCGKTYRALTCCGGTTDGTTAAHLPDCPSIVRSALSWIEDTRHGDKIRLKGLMAFEAIVCERDQLRASLRSLEGALPEDSVKS